MVDTGSNRRDVASRRTSGPPVIWSSVAAVLTVSFYLLFSIPHVATAVQRDRGYVSDFGRDAIGAELVRSGESPYQIVRLRTGAIPNLFLDDRGWIAHSPTSIAAARALTAIADVDTIEHALAIIALTTPLIVGIALYMLAKVRGPLRIALLGAPLVSVSTVENLIWLQAMGLVALALIVALHAADRQRTSLAAVALGLVVAVKVWPAYLAVAIHRQWVRISLLVGLFAVIVTLLLTPWSGGVAALGDWLLRALPANTAEHVGLSFSLASTLGIPPAFGLVVYTVTMVLLARTEMPTEIRVAITTVAHLSLAPLVWPWMVFGLLPALIWPIVRGHTTMLVTAASLAIPAVSMAPLLATNSAALAGLTRNALLIGQGLALGLWSVALWRRSWTNTGVQPAD